MMRPAEASLTVGPDESAVFALQRAAGNDLGRLAVLDGDRLAGYLSLKDITHVLALNGLTQDGAAAGARSGREGRHQPRRAA
jgi:CBS domain-containing protein